MAAVCVAKCGFVAESEEEMSVAQGEKVLAIGEDGGWMLADSIDAIGKHGYVPSAFFDKVADIPTEMLPQNTTEYPALVITHPPESLPTDDGEIVSPAPTAASSEGLPDLVSETKKRHSRAVDFMDAILTPPGQQERRRSSEIFGSLASQMMRAKSLTTGKLPIFAIFEDERVCFRARADRVKIGLSTKAKTQIIKKFFQKRPDLRRGMDLSDFRAYCDSPACLLEAERGHHREGTVILEIMLKKT